jgi:ATP-dependent helicase/nuclease subunit B
VEEDYLIYSALSKPSHILRLSYAWSDLESRALRPSLLIARFKQLYPQLEMTHDLIENTELEHKLISTPNSTYKYLLEQMRSYLDGREIDPIWWDVHSWYWQHPEWQKRHQAILGGFYYNNQPERLGAKEARQLYDRPLKASVSSLEKFINCPFAHFMHYGLRPQARALFELGVPDLGDILHRILQGVSRRLSLEKLSFADLDQSTCHRITDQVSEELMADYQQGIFHSSSRYRYMSQRLKRISRRAAWTLSTQLQKGQFAFAGHEIRFGLEDYCHLPALKVELLGGEIIYLEGRIDRLDLLEEGDEVYVKIIDYKSGPPVFAGYRFRHGGPGPVQSNPNSFAPLSVHRDC